MTVEFSGDPFVKEFPAGPLTVCLNGRDEATEEYIQCRVDSAALSRPAGGITQEKLCREFERQRGPIEKAAKRLYASGRGQKQEAYTVIWLGAADL